MEEEDCSKQNPKSTFKGDFRSLIAQDPISNVE